MYGTWKRLNAVAVSTNDMSTHSDAAAGGVPAGTAKVSRKKTGRAIAPSIIIGRREPRRNSILSDLAPITGSMITSQTFATGTTTPATIAATPRGAGRK